MIWPEPGARDPDEMAAEDVPEDRIPEKTGDTNCCLQKFTLFETESKFYMIGRNKTKTLWKVLKIDRLEPSELNIDEDSTTYSESECNELLKRIDEGNKPTGGLKFLTHCYGIVGFIKFLGPYYMLLITGRREIGVLCGHSIYAVTKSEMIALPNSSIQVNVADSKNENRYKKLLSTVDLTKDFYFSYSYLIMRSLQKNACDVQTGEVLYETMFVWNEFLTREIRNHVRNNIWTVALVYGFFKQAKLSISGKDFKFTLIARRSRHYAGTRYLKRGVNEMGRVANDVETEQIVFEEILDGIPPRISSVVQNRGSIPLFWSQETSKLNLKPDITLQKKNKDYAATKLHFDNLVDRYGNPIIILNLIKSEEKKPRESILRAEFANAIEFINKDLSEENRLKFLHWDLHKHSRSKAKAVLRWLGILATNILNLTGFFYCEVTPNLTFEGALRIDDVADWSIDDNDDSNKNTFSADDFDMSGEGSQEDNLLGSETSGQEERAEVIFTNSSICSVKPVRLQKGVLRTNCIDCLDRTNVAQYVFGLAAIGQQLYALDLIDVPKIDLEAPLADVLMRFYERMGDTLALQYGGSAAHNKIFSERRGQWKAATQSQEFLRTLQRYYNNAYVDAGKQAAINLFLGHFQLQQGKLAIWEPEAEEDARSFVKRSFSDGNILRGTYLPELSGINRKEGHAKSLSESTPEITACDSDVSYSRYTLPESRRHVFADKEYFCFYETGDSNFLDLDWFSSLNLDDENSSERSTVVNTPSENLSTDSISNGITSETSPPLSKNGSAIKGKLAKVGMPYDVAEMPNSLGEFSDRFANWVLHGEAICY